MSEDARLTAIEQLALRYHKEVEGEYGCGYPQSKCPGVLRLIKLLDEAVASHARAVEGRAVDEFGSKACATRKDAPVDACERSGTKRPSTQSEGVAARARLAVPQPANAEAIKKSLDKYAQYLGYKDAAALLSGGLAAPPQDQELFEHQHDNKACHFPGADQDCDRPEHWWISKANLGRLALPAWQPIETAPKDRFIVGALIRDGQLWRVHEMKHNGLAFYTKAGGSLPQMTHWMPLPQPPAAAQEQE